MECDECGLLLGSAAASASFTGMRCSCSAAPQSASTEPASKAGAPPDSPSSQGFDVPAAAAASSSSAAAPRPGPVSLLDFFRRAAPNPTSIDSILAPEIKDFLRTHGVSTRIFTQQSEDKKDFVSPLQLQRLSQQLADYKGPQELLAKHLGGAWAVFCGYFGKLFTQFKKVRSAHFGNDDLKLLLDIAAGVDGVSSSAVQSLQRLLIFPENPLVQLGSTRDGNTGRGIQPTMAHNILYRNAQMWCALCRSSQGDEQAQYLYSSFKLFNHPKDKTNVKIAEDGINDMCSFIILPHLLRFSSAVATELQKKMDAGKLPSTNMLEFSKPMTLSQIFQSNSFKNRMGAAEYSNLTGKPWARQQYYITDFPQSFSNEKFVLPIRVAPDGAKHTVLFLPEMILDRHVNIFDKLALPSFALRHQEIRDQMMHLARAHYEARLEAALASTTYSTLTKKHAKQTAQSVSKLIQQPLQRVATMFTWELFGEFVETYARSSYDVVCILPSSSDLQLFRESLRANEQFTAITDIRPQLLPEVICKQLATLCDMADAAIDGDPASDSPAAASSSAAGAAATSPPSTASLADLILAYESKHCDSSVSGVQWIHSTPAGVAHCLATWYSVDFPKTKTLDEIIGPDKSDRCHYIMLAWIEPDATRSLQMHQMFLADGVMETAPAPAHLDKLYEPAEKAFWGKRVHQPDLDTRIIHPQALELFGEMINTQAREQLDHVDSVDDPDGTIPFIEIPCFPAASDPAYGGSRAMYLMSPTHDLRPSPGKGLKKHQRDSESYLSLHHDRALVHLSQLNGISISEETETVSVLSDTGGCLATLLYALAPPSWSILCAVRPVLLPVDVLTEDQLLDQLASQKHSHRFAFAAMLELAALAVSEMLRGAEEAGAAATMSRNAAYDPHAIRSSAFRGSHSEIKLCSFNIDQLGHGQKHPRQLSLMLDAILGGAHNAAILVMSEVFQSVHASSERKALPDAVKERNLVDLTQQLNDSLTAHHALFSMSADKTGPKNNRQDHFAWLWKPSVVESVPHGSGFLSRQLQWRDGTGHAYTPFLTLFRLTRPPPQTSLLLGVINVHLAPNEGTPHAECRQAQMRAIGQWILKRRCDDREITCYIVVGDFNVYSSAEIKQLCAVLSHTARIKYASLNEGMAPTMVSTAPGTPNLHAYDHILVAEFDPDAYPLRVKPKSFEILNLQTQLVHRGVF